MKSIVFIGFTSVFGFICFNFLFKKKIVKQFQEIVDDLEGELIFNETEEIMEVNQSNPTTPSNSMDYMFVNSY